MQYDLFRSGGILQFTIKHNYEIFIIASVVTVLKSMFFSREFCM